MLSGSGWGFCWRRWQARPLCTPLRCRWVTQGRVQCLWCLFLLLCEQQAQYLPESWTSFVLALQTYGGRMLRREIDAKQSTKRLRVVRRILRRIPLSNEYILKFVAVV